MHNFQSMTCGVLLLLAEMQCAVTRCDVRAEPILVVTCDVRAVHFQACEVRPQYCTFLAIMKELTIEICFLLV